MIKLYVDGPGRPFCFSASTFLKGEVFNSVCPYQVTDSSGVSYDTQWSLIAKTSNGIQVEFCADIVNPLSGPQVFTLVEGISNRTRPALDGGLFFNVINKSAVKFHMQDGSSFIRRLNFGRGGVYRSGPARITLGAHNAHNYGGIHAYVDAKVHSNAVGLALNFHNGLIPAKGDFYFSAIELLLPEGVDFSEVIPYGTKHGSFLIAPGLHMIPQRRQLSRRLQIHLSGVAPDSAMLGQGFGNYFNGGFLPGNYRVGHLTNSKQKVAGEYNNVLNKFSNSLGEFATTVQPDRVWQSQNVEYGGMTGGTDIEAIPDPEVADAKDTRGLEMIMMRSNRYRNRQMGPIIEFDGDHVVCETYKLPDDSLPWMMFSSKFQVSGGSVKDQPFLFSKAQPNDGACSYKTALMSWGPIDHQHMRRFTKQDQQLVWYMNDPLARMYCIQDAEMQRMCYWDLKGGRLNTANFGFQTGTDLGRELAWMMDSVAFGVSIGGQSPEHLSGLSRWLNNAVAILEKVALPNGLVNVKRGGKAFTDPPFSSQYYGTQMFETCFLLHALVVSSHVLGSPHSAISNLISGIWDYAWDHSKPGPQYKTPTHKKDAAGVFQLLSSCPHLDNKLETFNLGAIPGYAWSIKMSDPMSTLQPDLMFMAHHGSTTLQQALTKALGNTSTYAFTASSIATAQEHLLGMTE